MFTLVYPNIHGSLSFICNVPKDAIDQEIAEILNQDHTHVIVHHKGKSFYVRSISGVVYDTRLSLSLHTGSHRGIFWSTERIQGSSVLKAHRSVYNTWKGLFEEWASDLEPVKADKSNSVRCVPPLGGVTYSEWSSVPPPPCHCESCEQERQDAITDYMNDDPYDLELARSQGIVEQ